MERLRNVVNECLPLSLTAPSLGLRDFAFLLLIAVLLSVLLLPSPSSPAHVEKGPWTERAWQGRPQGRAGQAGPGQRGTYAEHWCPGTI